MTVGRSSGKWRLPTRVGVLQRGAGVLAIGALACGDDGSPGLTNVPQTQLTCSIDTNRVRSGGVTRDGIPSLQDPPLVGKDHPATDYLDPDSRVIGVVVDGQPIAVPHGILWWHEIVNLNRGGEQVSVTFCPLTGSSLGFDRSTIGADLGVSGLLFNSNLIMFDRNTGASSLDSLWPQMLSEARCGPKDGTRLPQIPVVEMSWEGWRSIHPETLVISGELEFDRDYTRYPYGNYDDLGADQFFFPMPTVDERRPQKEVVIGVPNYSRGGVAFSTLTLAQAGPYSAVPWVLDDAPIVLLWDTARRGGMVYDPILDGEQLTFITTDEGIFDEGTGSQWNVMGRAISGPLAGMALDPIEETYVAFWGAWINFHNNSKVWAG